MQVIIPYVDTATFEQRSKWQEYWLVDPLDGTQDFLEQTGEFCICIAYIKNHQAIFGLVYNQPIFLPL
jgi:3'(2'), 5'-bisphosphate nucleotidase